MTRVSGIKRFKCLRLFSRTGLLAFRVVIPFLVRRDLAARRALRDRPFVTASWTDAAGPESVPDGRATRDAGPSVFRDRPIFAFGAVDFRLARHGNT